MKRKSFKKALAGISAAAMLVSAMPMTLIADAYSYTNINGIGLFSDLSADITADSAQNSGEYSYKSGTTFSNASLNINLNGFCVADYAKYQINEVYATDENGKAVTNKINSAEYNWAQAAADIIASDPDFIQGVTFDQTGDPRTGKAESNANFGKIKTITLSMPVNKAGGKGNVTDTVYENIEFTVVRNKDDIIKSFSNNALNEPRHIILAGSGNTIDLDAAPDESLQTQLSYTGDIDINLNGNTLVTEDGIQVSGKKMRIWGSGTISSASTSTDSTLAAYGSSSVIELYDNVTINNQSSDSTKAAISGEGTLIMCGDNVVVKHAGSGTKAIGNASSGGIATFIAGDYKYNSTTDLFTGTDGTSNAGDKDNFKLNGTTGTDTTVVVSGLQQFATMKIHNYNKYGFEVTDRTGDWSNSTNYLDVDPSTPDVKDYGYEPVRNVAGDTIILNGASQTVVAKNVGQLYFLAQQINNDKFTTDVTAKLANESFDFKNAPLDWEPIDATDIVLNIDGKFTGTGSEAFDKYSVIKNLKVNVAAGDAGFVAKTKGNVSNSITNLGFENSSVTGKGSVGTVVGFGDSVNIANVYVNNSAVKGTVKGGNYNGALAGTLYNSTINHTYSAADVQPVAIISGSTVTYLAKNGIKTTEGMTNFYDSGLVTPASGSSSATYLVGETSTNFKNGTVAFKLNGHDPAQGGTAGIIPNGFLSDSTTYNASCSVDGNTTAPYDKDYKDDIFGQDLSSTGKGTSYPTFINITDTTTVSGQKLASNRVFREIVTQCTGEKEKWTSSNANFLNTEADRNKSGHTDDNSNDICDTCKAYKISEKNFDKSLIPFLLQSTTTKYGIAPDNNATPIIGDGWLNVDEIDAITKVYIDLTTESTSSLKVSDIVDAINAEDASGNSTPTLKGIDILNQKKTGVSTLTAVGYDDAKYVKTYVFIVNDAVLCRYVADAQSTDAPKKKGFLVATNAAGSNTYAAATSWESGFEGGTATSSSMQSVANATATDKNDFYVFADKDTNGDSLKTAQFTYDVNHNNGGAKKLVKFQIAFKGNVKHNDVEDYKADGSLNASLSPSGNVKVQINEASAAASKHTYTGVECGCLIKTEECTSTPTDITYKTHKMTCGICGHNSTASGEAHAYETLFTIGNVTVKRCIGCGYVTATKETIITAATAVLSRPAFYDDATQATSKYFRQSYDFTIAAGDGEIVSYGVIYKKNPTASSAVNTNKFGTSAKNYFKTDSNSAIVLNTEELAEDGVNYTSRKAVKSSLTYRANISMPNVDDTVEVVGYVIYKDYQGTYGIKKTELTKQSFEDVAYAEIENTNVIAEAEHYKKVSGKTEREVFPYTFDIADDCKFINYGVLLTTNKTNQVTADTKTTDANFDGSYNTADGVKGAKKAPSSDAIKSLTYAPSMVMNGGNVGTIRAYAVVEKYDLEWTIYTDVQSYTKPTTGSGS